MAPNNNIDPEDSGLFNVVFAKRFKNAPNNNI